jgi:transposase-like protein
MDIVIGNRGVFGPNANAAYYSIETRRRAVAMREIFGLSAIKVAAEVGCDPRTVERWRKDHHRAKVPLGSLLRVALVIMK